MVSNNSKICKNCALPINGKYCSNCGQDSSTHRISLHYIWHDLQHGLLHFDNGIFYTIKQLLYRPGHTIKDFIDGKRVSHFKPFSFLIIMATIYGLLSKNAFVNSVDLNSADSVLKTYVKMVEWTLHHLTYSSLALIITTTIASYLAFKKQGYNFAEHLILNTYYRGLVLLIMTLLIPLMYLSDELDIKSFIVYTPVSQTIDFLLMYWCYNQFFDKMSRVKSLGVSLLAYTYMSIINILIFAMFLFLF